MDRMEAAKLLWEALERAWPEYEKWDEISAADREFYAEAAEYFLSNVATQFGPKGKEVW